MAHRDAAKILDEIIVQCARIRDAVEAIAIQIRDEKDLMAAEGEIEPEPQRRVPGLPR